MNIRRTVQLCSCCIVSVWIFAFLFLSIPGVAQQSPRNPHKHVPSVVSNGQAPVVGSLPITQMLQMTIMLPLRNQAALTNLLGDLYNPASPNYHHFLSVQEFTDQFSPTEQDYENVTQWAKDHGFTIVSSSQNRLVLDASGSVAQVNAALNVSMNVYRHPTENRLSIRSIGNQP